MSNDIYDEREVSWQCTTSAEITALLFLFFGAVLYLNGSLSMRLTFVFVWINSKQAENKYKSKKRDTK